MSVPASQTQTVPDLDRAADFLWRSARLLDRVRFAHLFQGGSRDAVLAALRAYQNPDGGFGHALEPDLRAPDSQPAAVSAAFEILHQIDAFSGPMVEKACDFLLTCTGPDGGLPFVLASAASYPAAPWWQPGMGAASSVTFAAPIAGLLHRHRVAHPLRDRLTAYCWQALAAFDPPDFTGQAWAVARIGTAYEARALLAFLGHVDDPRGEPARARLGRLVLDRGLVELDPRAPGSTISLLDYAPSPHSPAHPLFAAEIIGAHLDTLIAAQRDDGGWMFRWMDWNPATTLEWRGWLTVETLLTLRAYGRLP